MPVNMSYRLRLSAARFMIARLRCQTVFPRTSGETTKCDRSTVGTAIQRIAAKCRLAGGIAASLLGAARGR
jgi:hypothetical protein